MHLPSSPGYFYERLSILINQIDADHKYAYITGDFKCNTLLGCDSSISTDLKKKLFFLTLLSSN